MLYDRHLMQALFQLQIGNPGSSFAVEIARKIGLPEDVIADASEIVGSEYINADKYLQDIVRDKRYWEGKRQTIRQREKHMEDTIARYQTEMEELQNHGRRLSDKLKKKLNECCRNQTPASKIPSVRLKKLRPKRKDPLGTSGAERFPYFPGNNDFKEQEEKIARKMEKLKEKQERKKNKKRTENAASQTAATPKVIPITVGENVKIKGTDKRRTGHGNQW